MTVIGVEPMSDDPSPTVPAATFAPMSTWTPNTVPAAGVAPAPEIVKIAVASPCVATPPATAAAQLAPIVPTHVRPAGMVMSVVAAVVDVNNWRPSRIAAAATATAAAIGDPDCSSQYSSLNITRAI